ncbi:transcription-repair coupling factor [Candidatus Ishikawella capsulata]|uniref:Transcription-repair-coupling factor n=1 Tax=Candidatus Ishikawaella capsulata Mpkobe TaxID=476281 RepID=C5WD10_9ENTR|nr:transcription-repair coupling factor [Candidatus Ishikawaella capsulata]BAH83216.1 transcription-repair coupling factor [Candidatus Ishikawaella capsulata Mpkobe]
MIKQIDYVLPSSAGDCCYLGQMLNQAISIECTNIIEHHLSTILMITPDRQMALRLEHEISYLTKYPVFNFLDWETLPYDIFSPNRHIVSRRLGMLFNLPKMNQGMIILPISTLMQRVCPDYFLHTSTLIIKIGQILSFSDLYQRLNTLGYNHVDQVASPGEYTVKNSIIDIFPMGSYDPYRINFSHSICQYINTFDINSQRIQKAINTIYILPTHEFPLDKVAIEIFRKQYKILFNNTKKYPEIHDMLSKGILPDGIEYLQPLFFDKPLSSIFSYLPRNTLVIMCENIQKPAFNFWHNIKERYENSIVDITKPVVEPIKLWLHPNDIFKEIKKFPCIFLNEKQLYNKPKTTNLSYVSLPNINIKIQEESSLSILEKFIKNFPGMVFFSISSVTRIKKIQKTLAKINLFPKILHNLKEAKVSGKYLIITANEYGCINQKRQFALICENDLFGNRVIKYNSINTTTLIDNLSELSPGQLIVHLEHGIGRYMGLITLEVGGITSEYLIVTYANNDKLYVPISSLHLITSYRGKNHQNFPLHNLGSDVWIKTREKAIEKVQDFAVELLDIYSQRLAKKGFAFTYNHKKYEKFCEDFLFEDTPDQAKASNEIINDMCKARSMDRVLCGDVGFGKTEVAMRAAFLACINKKQVAVLVPTTLLAQQHFETFRNRFFNWPIRIEMLSRFIMSTEQNELVKQLNEGKIDIIIGTHKLLMRNIKWHNLGLLIIDEEQRFGVHHKEYIKTMYSNVDILTLTATPIPRTLNMAINGIRDISIIATPPDNRLSVKTFVREYNSILIREAILREIMRGGQIYYVYNNVKNITKVFQTLTKLVPEVRIAISHGQMPERDLERVMHDFHHQRFNLLLCTSIIETGIDIPNVNTIIIERADNFGLSQLYQLRGRVGRSSHQAYAWLLTPNPKMMNGDAQKRLDAISSLETLGCGFAVASHDLEIRGAGDILGKNQSGQIKNIGFSLYLELLENAVKAIKAGYQPSLEYLKSKKPEIELCIPAFIPDKFIADVNNRLLMYRRINLINNIADLHIITNEIIERFGELPIETSNFLAVSAIQIQALSIGVKRIKASKHGIYFEFFPNNKINLDSLINFMSKEPHKWKWESSTKLNFMKNFIDPTLLIKWIKTFLNILQ